MSTKTKVSSKNKKAGSKKTAPKKSVVKKLAAKKVVKSKPVKKAIVKSKSAPKKAVVKKIILKKAAPKKPTPKKGIAKAKQPIKKAPAKKTVKPVAKSTKPIAKAAKPTITKKSAPVKKATPGKPVKVIEPKPVAVIAEKAVKLKKEKAPVIKKPIVAPTTFRKEDTGPVKFIKEPAGKFEMEFVIRASEDMVFEFVSTESGLSEWFCDDVTIRNGIFTFDWDGQAQQAKLVKEIPPVFIRYQWLDKNDGSYFEFRTQKDELTNDISLIITDFASDKSEEMSSRLLWQSQVDKLLHVLGSFF